MAKKNIKKIIKEIKLIISDVDGVLTDGGMYYSNTGEQLKKFNTRDGMAIELLSEKQIPVVLITRENSKSVQRRAKKIKVAKLYLGIKNKEEKIYEICSHFKVQSKEIAYIGDDVNDFNIMKIIGYSFCPSDSVLKIKQISDYICEAKGGEGVLREVADLILSN